MDLIDKTERYLAGRKTPVNIVELANRFLVDRSSVNKVLNQLVKKRKMVVVKVGRVNWYRMP